MRKRVYDISIIILLCICSASLTSCQAITDQNIVNIDSDEEINGNSNVADTAMPDVIGKVISVSESSIKIELIEQKQNNEAINSNDDDNNQDTQISTSSDAIENNSTSIEKILSVSSDAKITQESSINPQNVLGNAKSSIKLMNLKKGQVAMIWYKEDTEIVDKINVMSMQ